MEEYPPPPKLSSSQKSYRENPDLFRSRLHARAESLFETGYTAYPGRVAHEFVVAYTDAKSGSITEYVVHLTDGTCTCPFFMRQVAGETLSADPDEPLVPCKHLIGLPTLAREVRRELMHGGQVHAAGALFRHWMVYQTYKRHERQAVERESARQAKQQEQERIAGRHRDRDARKETGYANCAA